MTDTRKVTPFILKKSLVGEGFLSRGFRIFMKNAVNEEPKRLSITVH